MGRFRHVNDVRENDDGSLVYAGDYYRIAGDPVEAKRTFLSFVAGTVLLAVLILGSGTIDADNAIGSFTVIVPLIGEVCCLFVTCWLVAKVIAGKGRIRFYTLESLREKIPVASKLLVIFSLTGMVFSVIYLFRHGIAEGETLKSIAYPVLKLMTASTAVGYDKYFAMIRWVSA